jgi:hypothetical protein
MVLNLETGNISPQYHLVFDDTFSTVYSDGSFNADVWNSLVTSNLELHDDAPSAVPSTFDFIDTKGRLPTADPIADVLFFIDNLPENHPENLPTIFPSLPNNIDDHLPSSKDGPTASFRSPLTMKRPLSSPEGARPFISSEVTTSLQSLPTSSPEGGFRRSS